MGTSYGLIKIEDYGDLNQWENSLSDIHNIRSLLNQNREKINKTTSRIGLILIFTGLLRRHI